MQIPASLYLDLGGRGWIRGVYIGRLDYKSIKQTITKLITQH